jgi:ribosomal protein L11 methyltransferase
VPGELVITLDPGMAFGTGRHETTALCARMLEAYMRPGASVLDVGCGSGILSIAAALLGAGEALGVDLDEDAVETARKNVADNGCADRVRIVKGDLVSGLSFTADVAVANLTEASVAALARVIGARLRPDGVFIASGVLADRLGPVAEAVEAAGFRVVKSAVDGEWGAVAAERA